jgi:hypothetical protein
MAELACPPLDMDMDLTYRARQLLF